MRGKRLYLQYVDTSLKAIHSAIDTFNRVHDKHKFETTLILLSRAWELLGKGVLIKKKQPIAKDKRGNSLSAEQVIVKLVHFKVINSNHADHMQQVISLRNEAVHGLLPEIPVEILHHLFYFSCKFYKGVIDQYFKKYSEQIRSNYLSISFRDLTTYCDKVQRLVGRLRKGRRDEKRLVWLLERGIRFEGGEYISQDKFEKEYMSKKKRKILPHLGINKFLKNAEMIRIIPVQAPKGFTADVILRKGSIKDVTLPVQVKKTIIELDYPFLTNGIAAKLGHNTQFISKSIAKLGLKGNTEYHQKIRSSKSSYVNRYSQKTLDYLKDFLKKNPKFNPYRETK